MKIGVEQGGVETHTPIAESGVSNFATIVKSGDVKCVEGYIFLSSDKAASSTIATITDINFAPKRSSFIGAVNTDGATVRALTVNSQGRIYTGDFSFGRGAWVLFGAYI